MPFPLAPESELGLGREGVKRKGEKPILRIGSHRLILIYFAVGTFSSKLGIIEERITKLEKRAE